MEVAYLVIPGENDADEHIDSLATWLSRINPAIPLHLSRYFPAYKYDKPPTPIPTLERLRGIAGEKLHYVYIGNAWQKGYADTLCPQCEEPLLERGPWNLRDWHLSQGVCPGCLRPADIIGNVDVTTLANQEKSRRV